MPSESQGIASLQMAMGYISSLSSQYDVLDNKATLLMGAGLVVLSIATSFYLAASLSAWLLVAPTAVVIVGAGLWLNAVRPRNVKEFIDPNTLAANYRAGGCSDNQIAWVLIDSLMESAGHYESLIATKAKKVFYLQIGFAALVLIVIVSVGASVAWAPVAQSACSAST